MNIIKGMPKPKGIFITVAAVEGWGKSTLGSKMPNPVFIDTDKGISGDHIMRIDTNCGCDEMLGLVQEFRTNPPEGVDTIVIDTMDKLIDRMTDDLCRMRRWESMEAQQYFKCWVEYKAKYFDPMLNGLKDLTRERPITVLILSHVAARKFEKPNGEAAWDRWETSFPYKALCQSLKQASDLYVFGDFLDRVMEADKRAGEVKKHATGSGKRMAYSEHNGAFDAKCREFITLADGSPFPKAATLDDFTNALLEAIQALRDTDTENPKTVHLKEKDESQPSESSEQVAAENLYGKLCSLIKQFNIDEDLLKQYLPTTKVFGLNPPPLEKCNAKSLEWLCKGISQGIVNNEFIKNKINKKD